MAPKNSITVKRNEKETENFYGEILGRLTSSGIPFMVGGAYALREYADILRDTKDLDLFCRPGDYPRILQECRELGYHVEVTDPDWLAKVHDGGALIDVIFGMGNRLSVVDDTWLQHASVAKVFGQSVKLVPPEEMIWSKIYVQERDRYDGADVNHIIRKLGSTLDWKRLFARMNGHWELLFSAILSFRFVYPSERNAVPEWLVEECISRLRRQMQSPEPQDRVCRGPMVAYSQYRDDILQWGYRW